MSNPAVTWLEARFEWIWSRYGIIEMDRDLFTGRDYRYFGIDWHKLLDEMNSLEGYRGNGATGPMAMTKED